MKNLAKGDHTLKVVVADGESTATFTILDNPKTGDNLLFNIFILLVSAVGLVSTLIYTKKTIKLD